MREFELSEREKNILRYVIHQFILTASPVGSRFITKKYGLGLSAATVRNIMYDLEQFGLLGHPHTSAGRIPTDKGYRFYVDSLMDPPYLEKGEIDYIDSSMDNQGTETDDLLKISSTLLSEITSQIACVTFPSFEQAILEKLQIVELSSSKILIVITIRAGLVKTITLELKTDTLSSELQKVQRILNERLSGLKFSEIRSSFRERLKDYDKGSSRPVIRLFLDSVDKIFADVKKTDKAVITGASNVLRQPEFEDIKQFGSVIELIENKEVIVHLMDKDQPDGLNDIKVFIGSENTEKKLDNYSLVTKEYKVGTLTGKLGIIGPKRMNYPRMIAVVTYLADTLSQELTGKK